MPSFGEKEMNIFLTTKGKDIDEVVEDIKWLSWCWSLSRLKIAS
jgi:hypothetical protein